MTMKMRGNSKLLLSLFLCTIFIQILSANSASSSPLAPALYVFGDSLLDSGNNNLLPTLAKADYPPYGDNFAKGATGRFTNGRTVADFIAEYLGLPYAPPYMSLENRGALTGYNYASATCGILPKTGILTGLCLNLDKQLSLFESTVKQELPSRIKGGAAGLASYLSKSIFVVSIGSNDYITYFRNPTFYDTTKLSTPQLFTQSIITTLSQSLQKLYNLGARKVIVFEIGPIGCIPSITRKTNHVGQCVEAANQLVSYFNQALPIMLTTLQSQCPGSHFVLGRVNSLGYDVATKPSTYGLVDSRDACCTTWENGTSICIPLLGPCPSASKNYFWDGFHPTEAVYSILAKACINGTSVCIPNNIQELVQI